MKNIRKLSRLGIELHLTASMAVLDWVSDDHDLAVVALLVLSRCADDWVEGDMIRRPMRLSRSISVRAIARSLSAPPSTIQRYATKLIKRGILVELPNGVAINNAGHQGGPVVTTLVTAHDSYVRLIEDVAGSILFDPPPKSHHVQMARILAVALDTWLVPFEVARARASDWTSSLLVLCIGVANVRHVTTDPLLSDQYADVSTPDCIRRPINTRALATLARQSYGTTYRHCQRLAALNMVRHDRGGWLRTTAQLIDQDVEEGVKALVVYYVQHINGLVSRGLDARHAVARYIRGRPDYVALPV